MSSEYDLKLNQELRQLMLKSQETHQRAIAELLCTFVSKAQAVVVINFLMQLLNEITALQRDEETVRRHPEVFDAKNGGDA